MKFIPNSVTRSAGKQLLRAKYHSPTLLFVGGVTGVVTAAVLACRATLKTEQVLVDHNLNLAEARSLRSDAVYTDDSQYSKDVAFIYVQTAGEFCKLYGPSIVLGVASLTALTGSHRILSKRNAALTAAYSAVDQAFKQYRERVRNELGEEKDRQFRYGTSTKTVVEETDKGIKKVDVTTFNKDGISGYAKLFDESNANWQPDVSVNLTFLRAVENQANNKLRVYGWVLLNDVYDALGYQPTTAGAVVGWTRDGGDKQIDFGLNSDNPLVEDFLLGLDKSVLLDFNVEGPVFRAIDKYAEVY